MNIIYVSFVFMFGCKMSMEASAIFQEYAHETRKNHIRFVQNFSEQLLFYVAYNKDSLIELLSKPLVAPENITRDTKLWDIGCLSKNSLDKYRTREEYVNEFAPYIQELALRLYKLNIDIASITCGFRTLLEDDIRYDEKKSLQHLLYEQKIGQLNFDSSTLSKENQEILYGAMYGRSSYPGIHDPYVRWAKRYYITTNSIDFPVTMDTTLGEIVDILEERTSKLELQALSQGYEYVYHVFDQNAPAPHIYYGHRRRNYDPYYNILFYNSDQKERFYEGLKTPEGKRRAKLYVESYKKDLDEKSFANMAVGSHTDLLFINILCTTDENNTIDWKKIQKFVDYTKTIGIYTDYQRIRGQRGEYVVNFMRSRESAEERNAIYNRLDTYFNESKQLDSTENNGEYAEFEEVV